MGNVMAAQRLLHVVLYGTGFYVGIKTFCVDECVPGGEQLPGKLFLARPQN
jgi:hypothetical protein